MAWHILKLWMEERPPVWRVAANMLNKQSWTSDKGWSSSLGAEWGGNNSFPLKVSCYKIFTRKASDLDCYCGMNKARKRDLRFGTWNVRSLYRAGSLTAAARELTRFTLDLVGMQEVRWDKGGTVRAVDYNFFYGKGNENHQSGTRFCTPQNSINS